jgi:hypothetical protein
MKQTRHARRDRCRRSQVNAKRDGRGKRKNDINVHCSKERSIVIRDKRFKKECAVDTGVAGSGEPSKVAAVETTARLIGRRDIEGIDASNDVFGVSRGNRFIDETTGVTGVTEGTKGTKVMTVGTASGRGIRSVGPRRFIVMFRGRKIGRIKVINGADDRREFIPRMRARELGVKITHFSFDVHDILIIRIFMFSGKIVLKVNSSNTTASERSITSILDLFECIQTSKAIGRKAKEMPAASNTMGRCITDTTNVGRMRTTGTRSKSTRSGWFNVKSSAARRRTTLIRTTTIALSTRRTTALSTRRTTARMAMLKSSDVGSGDRGICTIRKRRRINQVRLE